MDEETLKKIADTLQIFVHVGLYFLAILGAWKVLEWLFGLFFL